MKRTQLSGGLVHELPVDLATALLANPKALVAWEDISIKARNEWICWTVTVKQDKTRKEHVKRVCSELAEGIHRPCCWVGCIHRTDKAVSPWAQIVLIGKQPQAK
jgi:integrase